MTEGAAARARSRAAYALGRFELAADEATRAISADPTSADAFGLLACAQIQMKDPRAALDSLARGLAQDPGAAWLHRLRAFALLDLRRRKEALAAANEALRLAPQAAEAHYAHAAVLDARWKRKAALAAIDRAMALDPDAAHFPRLAGDILLDYDPARALQHYRRSLELKPNSAPTLNSLGTALRNLGQPREAAQAFQAAIRADPSLRVSKRNAHQVLGGAAISGLGAVVAAVTGGVTGPLARLADEKLGRWFNQLPDAWILTMGAVILLVGGALIVRGHRLPPHHPQNAAQGGAPGEPRAAVAVYQARRRPPRGQALTRGAALGQALVNLSASEPREAVYDVGPRPPRHCTASNRDLLACAPLPCGSPLDSSPPLRRALI